MKRLFFLLGLLLSLMASQAGSQELYQWTDETGKINIVDEMRRVPERYRQGMKIYRASSGLKRRPPTEKREAREPAPAVPTKKGRTETSPLTPEERIARIETLHREKDELEQERGRQRTLQRRWRSKASRSTIYQRRIQQLDQELEAIQKELDAIRPKGQ